MDTNKVVADTNKVEISKKELGKRNRSREERKSLKGLLSDYVFIGEGGKGQRGIK